MRCGEDMSQVFQEIFFKLRTHVLPLSDCQDHECDCHCCRGHLGTTRNSWEWQERSPEQWRDWNRYKRSLDIDDTVDSLRQPGDSYFCTESWEKKESLSDLNQCIGEWSGEVPVTYNPIHFLTDAASMHQLLSWASGKINLNEKKVPVFRLNRGRCWAAFDRKGTPFSYKQHSNNVVGETHQMGC